MGVGISPKLIRKKGNSYSRLYLQGQCVASSHSLHLDLALDDSEVNKKASTASRPLQQCSAPLLTGMKDGRLCCARRNFHHPFRRSQEEREQ